MTVYFAEDQTSGIVKIGCTNGRVQKRISKLGREHGLPNPPVLIGTMPGGRPVEQKIHRILSGHRIRGEWFLLNDGVRGFIETCIEKGDPELARAVHGNAIQPSGEEIDHRLHEWDLYAGREPR